MIDGAEEYRAEPCSVRNAGSQTNFPVDGGQRSKLKSRRVHVKDRLQVAICGHLALESITDGASVGARWGC